MRKYVKPIAVVNSNLAEGVYAASGCYTATASIHQTPDGGGQGTYRIQVNGKHDADHTKEAQTLTITFNQSVKYESSSGTLASAATGTTLVINYTYHQNPQDNIGLGDLVVTSGAGLVINDVKISD